MTHSFPPSFASLNTFVLDQLLIGRWSKCTFKKKKEKGIVCVKTPVACHLSRKRKTRQKKDFSDVNCSGHLNCYNSAFCCSLSVMFFVFLPCDLFLNFLKTCKDSLAWESLSDNHGDENTRLYFCLFYGITRFFHLKLFCKIVSVWMYFLLENR